MGYPVQALMPMSQNFMDGWSVEGWSLGFCISACVLACGARVYVAATWHLTCPVHSKGQTVQSCVAIFRLVNASARPHGLTRVAGVSIDTVCLHGRLSTEYFGPESSQFIVCSDRAYFLVFQTNDANCSSNSCQLGFLIGSSCSSPGVPRSRSVRYRCYQQDVEGCTLGHHAL
jgi:hypothetical protein